MRRGGYYAWRGRGPSPRQQEDARLAPVVAETFRATRRTYGRVRLTRELKARGHPYDNAAMESFYSTLKTEWLAQHPLRAPAETQADASPTWKAFTTGGGATAPSAISHLWTSNSNSTKPAVSAYPKLSAKPIQAHGTRALPIPVLPAVFRPISCCCAQWGSDKAEIIFTRARAFGKQGQFGFD